MSVILKHIEFCPDVKGPCLGEGCAAFKNTLAIVIDNPQTLVENMIGRSVALGPLTFALQVNCCQRHEMFVDKESLNLFLDFNKLFVGEKNAQNLPTLDTT